MNKFIVYTMFLLIFSMMTGCTENEDVKTTSQALISESESEDIKLTRVCEAMIGDNLWGYNLEKAKVEAGKELCIEELKNMPSCKDEYVGHLVGIANLSSADLSNYTADRSYLSICSAFGSEFDAAKCLEDFYAKYPWHKTYFECKAALEESDLANLESYYSSFDEKYISL